MVYIKLSFYTAKNSIILWRQSLVKKESLSNYIPDRGLISTIYKKLQKLNKSKNQIIHSINELLNWVACSEKNYKQPRNSWESIQYPQPSGKCGLNLLWDYLSPVRMAVILNKLTNSGKHTGKEEPLDTGRRMRVERTNLFSHYGSQRNWKGTNYPVIQLCHSWTWRDLSQHTRQTLGTSILTVEQSLKPGN